MFNIQKHFSNKLFNVSKETWINKMYFTQNEGNSK